MYYKVLCYDTLVIFKVNLQQLEHSSFPTLFMVLFAENNWLYCPISFDTLPIIWPFPSLLFLGTSSISGKQSAP